MADQYANCTVHHKMHSDRRFELLGELGGWTRNDASFRMVQLWARCTALKTDRPPAVEIRIHLGLRGEELLLAAALGERCADGSIRVMGMLSTAPEPRSSETTARVVTYAIASPDGTAIKVGRTRYIDRRLTSLQTAHHQQLALFGVVDGDHEASAHAHLDALGKRWRGEWFRLDSDTVEILAAHGIRKGGL